MIADADELQENWVAVSLLIYVMSNKYSDALGPLAMLEIFYTFCHFEDMVEVEDSDIPTSSNSMLNWSVSWRWLWGGQLLCSGRHWGWRTSTMKSKNGVEAMNFSELWQMQCGSLSIHGVSYLRKLSLWGGGTRQHWALISMKVTTSVHVAAWQPSWVT